MGFSDWLLQLCIGIGVLMVFMGVWLYTHFSQPHVSPDKPRPIWLGVAKVMAQMSDGRMVNVKVNLHLDKADAVDELDPHQPAFKALIQEVGTRTTREDLQGREGVRHFGASIRDSLNHYLEEQRVEGRVKDVAFEELNLMP